MSHLNTSIYHCLAVAAKSFLSWDRRICEKCFLRLGEQSAAVQPYLVHVMFLSGPSAAGQAVSLLNVNMPLIGT